MNHRSAVCESGLLFCHKKWETKNTDLFPPFHEKQSIIFLLYNNNGGDFCIDDDGIGGNLAG